MRWLIPFVLLHVGGKNRPRILTDGFLRRNLCCCPKIILVRSVWLLKGLKWHHRVVGLVWRWPLTPNCCSVLDPVLKGKCLEKEDGWWTMQRAVNVSVIYRYGQLKMSLSDICWKIKTEESQLTKVLYLNRAAGHLEQEHPLYVQG